MTNCINYRPANELSRQLCKRERANFQLFTFGAPQNISGQTANNLLRGFACLSRAERVYSTMQINSPLQRAFQRAKMIILINRKGKEMIVCASSRTVSFQSSSSQFAPSLSPKPAEMTDWRRYIYLLVCLSLVYCTVFVAMKLPGAEISAALQRDSGVLV